MLFDKLETAGPHWAKLIRSTFGGSFVNQVPASYYYVSLSKCRTCWNYVADHQQGYCVPLRIIRAVPFDHADGSKQGECGGIAGRAD